jgi:hypothetical protein
VQLHKVLYKWFLAMCYKGKPVFGTVTLHKVKSFYDGMKITDKCTFSEGSNKKLPVRTEVSIRTVW